MADETKNIANREQLVLCISWVSENNEVFQDPVGLTQVENTTASTNHAAIKIIQLSSVWT